MGFHGADGTVGEIRVGGRVAAGLKDWALKPDGAGGYRVVAMLVDPNPLYLKPSRSMELRLQMGKRYWRWRGVTLERDEVMPERVAIGAAGAWELL